MKFCFRVVEMGQSGDSPGPTFPPVIYCGAKYADAHSGKGMIPERVPIFGVCLNSLNPAHAGRFATSTAPPQSPFGRGAMSLPCENTTSDHVFRASRRKTVRTSGEGFSDRVGVRTDLGAELGTGSAIAPGSGPQFRFQLRNQGQAQPLPCHSDRSGREPAERRNPFRDQRRG